VSRIPTPRSTPHTFVGYPHIPPVERRDHGLVAKVEPGTLPRLLYMVHSLPPEEFTGSPLSTFGYAHALADRGWSVTVVYSSHEARSWVLTPERENGEPFDRVRVPASVTHRSWPVDAASASGPERRRSDLAFSDLLDQVSPDLVHVVNNVHLPLDWPEVAAARGIPIIRSVTCAEDLCGRIAPVSPRSGSDGYCIPPLTPKHCARCIASASDSATWAGVPDSLARKRARSVVQFGQVFTRIVFATPGFRRYFEQTLPLDPLRVRVIEMGVDHAPWVGRPDLGESPHLHRAAKPGRPTVFAWAGTLDPVKGLDDVAHAFTSPELLGRKDYRLVLMGGGNVALTEPMLTANPRITARGPYRSQDLPAWLDQADVGLSTSLFETFHRVTREYLLAGLPVIGSRAFGIPDIIRPGANGLLYDHADPDSLTRAVVALLDDPQLLAALTDGARRTTVRSVEEEAGELAALYVEVLGQRDRTANDRPSVPGAGAALPTRPQV